MITIKITIKDNYDVNSLLAGMKTRIYKSTSRGLSYMKKDVKQMFAREGYYNLQGNFMSWAPHSPVTIKIRSFKGTYHGAGKSILKETGQMSRDVFHTKIQGPGTNNKIIAKIYTTNWKALIHHYGRPGKIPRRPIYSMSKSTQTKIIKDVYKSILP